MKQLTYLFIFLFAITICTAQKKVLQLNLEVGSTYNQTSDINMDINQEVSGQNVDMNMGILGTMAYKVLSATGNAYVIEVKYLSLSMSMGMQGMTMEYDSDKEDPSDLMSNILSKMINKPFEVVILKNGKVEEVRGIEILYKNMFEDFPDISKAQQEQIEEQITKSYGEMAFKGNIEMITAVFPDSPVSINDSWKVETGLSSGVTASIYTTYTLKEETDDYYLLEGVSAIKTDKDAEYNMTGGMEMKQDMSGNMNSKIKIDKNSGWIVVADISQDISGDVEIKPSEQMPEGMQWPMSIKSEMKITN